MNINERDIFKSKESKDEIVKIMLQVLEEMGLEEAASTLSNESGI